MTTPPSLPLRFGLLALALLPPACQASGRTAERDVHGLIADERYREAVELAEERARRNPRDAQAIDDHRRASVAFLLEQGRRKSFLGEDEEALADFEHGASLTPELDQPRQWIARTRAKLADRWFQAAREAHANDDLPAALQGYETALVYDPEDEDSRAGVARVIEQMTYRDGLGEDYYNEGIRALRDYELYVAGSRFDYADKYREDEKPARRVKEVEHEISKQVTARAARFEAAGFYAAARTDYRVAAELDPDNQEAHVGLERMTVEAEAHELLKQGQMWLRRAEWDRAREVLDEGRSLTVVQKEQFDAAIERIDDERIQAAYQYALDLEHDFRYEQAIEAYAAILEEREFYRDSRARMSTLTDSVAVATELYARLEGVQDPEERLRILRQIDLVWPEYRDVPAQIDALTEQ